MLQTLVIFAALSVVAVSAEPKLCLSDYVGSHMILNEIQAKEGVEICDKCMQKYDVDLASLLLVEKNSLPEPTDSVKCYYMCYFKTYGSMDEDGTFKLSAVEDTMSTRNLNAASDCIKKIAADQEHCQKAYELYLCYLGIINKTL